MPCGPDEFQTGSGHAAASPRLRRRPRTRPGRHAAVNATSRPRAPRLQVQALVNVAPLAREGWRAAPRPGTKGYVASTTSRLSSNPLVEGFRPWPRLRSGIVPRQRRVLGIPRVDLHALAAPRPAQGWRRTDRPPQTSVAPYVWRTPPFLLNAEIRNGPNRVYIL